jgi:transcriptional regulator with XRE-family HTH domain
MELHERLRSAREATGLTRPEAETRAGLTPRTLERWEGGRSEPGVLGLARLAPILGVTLDVLVGGDALPLDEALDGLVARHGLDAVVEKVGRLAASALRKRT